MARFLNLENIVCDAKSPEAKAMLHSHLGLESSFSRINMTRMILPLAIKLQVFPECRLESFTPKSLHKSD